MTEPAKAEKEERGVRYPGDNLEAALDMLSRVREAIGFGAASRETVAEALGYRGISGTSARKIGVLTHFGLMDRVGGGAYKISELGKAVLMPSHDQEKSAAIAQAARSPALYRTLLEKYEGHALPTLLPNLLTREYGVFPGASESAARTFRETMEFAGLLRNGVLCAEPDPASSASEAAGEPGSDGAAPPAPPPAGGSSGNKADESPPPAGARQQYTIALDNAGRLASIQLPIPVRVRDLGRIKAWVDYMENVVDDEETPGISGN